ncbi:MAG TPA: SDR family oxidoreductase [Verrucomicrobiae bacterium]|jgi:NAD(P)-dependent dehydrogenase (short-subunit alcohol dehydrogenase family)|nr:SDR family oxidoreductase [Verrucomicrobiae bacterium]
MNRSIVITGATRGLGLALARRFLAAGDKVFGISRTRGRWAEVRRDSPNPANFTLLQCDLTSEAEIKACVKKILKAGVPDILINNAGDGTRLARVENITLKEYEHSQAVNLTAAFLVCKYFLPALRAKKGARIFNVSSMAGVRAVPNLFSYSAAKFGIMALTQCLAKENTDAGIECLTVCPGGMKTSMRASLFGREDAKKQQTPDFVAGLILDLVERRLPAANGSAVVIRHSRLWSIIPMPDA